MQTYPHKNMTAIDDVLANWPPFEIPTDGPHPERAELIGKALKMLMEALQDWCMSENINGNEWTSDTEFGRTEESDGILMRVHLTRGVKQHHFAMHAIWGKDIFWGGNIDHEYPQYTEPAPTALSSAARAC